MDFKDFSRRLYRWASEGVDMYGNTTNHIEVEVEWGFYALSASKAIFRARTYNCNLFSPVMMSLVGLEPTSAHTYESEIQLFWSILNS